MTKFLALLYARTMEFLRDRGTLIWNLVLPVFLVFGFAFAFGSDSETLLTIGYTGRPPESRFFGLPYAEYISYDSAEEAIRRVRFHQIDLFLDTASGAYYVNESNASGEIARELLTAMHGDLYTQEAVTGRRIRYVDWFLPGLIGMNLMFSGVAGVGFVIVRYRKNGVLKRLKATPVSALEFVSSQVVSRFLIVVVTSVVVFTGTNLFLNFVVLGSYLLLLLLLILAVLCMISLGLVFATRIRSEELAGGLINIITLPMILVSGVFFSLEGSPPAIQTASRFFPLTHFVDGARSIMLEGAGFAQIAPNVVALAGFTAAFLILASVLFRWE